MGVAPKSGSKTSGWALFVATYLGIAGALNLIWGIAAFAEKRNFHPEDLVLSTLTTWAWVAVIVGAAQLVGAVLVSMRRVGGVVIAASLGFVGLLTNFMAIGAFPVWSAILMGVNALILWAATVHSDELM